MPGNKAGFPSGHPAGCPSGRMRFHGTEYPGQRMLGIIMLGGFHLTSLPAHAVWIRTRSGKWYMVYLRKTGSFHDNSGTQQSDSGN